MTALLAAQQLRATGPGPDLLAVAGTMVLVLAVAAVTVSRRPHPWATFGPGMIVGALALAAWPTVLGPAALGAIDAVGAGMDAAGNWVGEHWT